jgi:hypothetical protein
LKDTPLLILLTKDQAGQEEELKRIGADAFMVKPLSPKDILKKVQEFLKGKDTNFKDEMPRGPKDELVHTEEKSSIDKTEVSSTLSKKEEQANESLDILEASDFMESFEASPSDSRGKEPHGFDWFMSELKKEMKEAKPVDLGVKQKSKEKSTSPEVTSLDREDLKKKDKDKKDTKVYEIDKDQKGYEDFVNEIKSEVKEPKVEESLDQKISSINYDKMIQDMIERVSTKIAQELAKKIDPGILRQIVQDEVEKLKKDGIKAN